MGWQLMSRATSPDREARNRIGRSGSIRRDPMRMRQGADYYRRSGIGGKDGGFVGQASWSSSVINLVNTSECGDKQ